MSRTIQERLLIAFLFISDTLMILAGWRTAFYVRIQGTFFPYASLANAIYYEKTVLFSLPLWWLCFKLCRLYKTNQLLGGFQEYASVTKGCSFGAIALIGVSVFLRYTEPSRGWLILGYVFTTSFVCAGRFAIRSLAYALRARGFLIRRALIIGANEAARAIVRQLTPSANSGTEVIGFVDDFLPFGTRVIDDLSVLGATPNLAEITKAQQIDEVILVSGSMAWESFQYLLRGISMGSDNYDIRLSPGFYEVLTTGIRVSYKNHVPLLEIERVRIAGIDSVLKNMLDWGLGTASLIATLPIMLLASVLIKIMWGNSILAATPVIGRNGRTFDMYRFNVPIIERRKNAVPPGKGAESLKRFLIQSGLEKLPQLFNVLCGQMSLIGPRPVRAVDTRSYDRWLPNLLTLKPGMTGPRVGSKNSEIALEEEMKLDLYYARNYSIWLDLQILFQTVPWIVRGERIQLRSGSGFKRRASDRQARRTKDAKSHEMAQPLAR
jgi:lipopolysaccharide/colanic/teichoic acid biosynthesis glycosyltransferase